MTQLEQSFADICAKHDLSCISLAFHPLHAGTFFTAYAHGNGGQLGSFSSEKLGLAIGSAVAELNAKRANGPVIELADEPLQIGEAA